MIGTREPPTSSKSQRYGSGFHGSPVVTNVRSDERSLRRRRRAAAARGPASARGRARSRAPARRSARAGRRGQSGAPSAKTIVAPSAPAPTTVHGPMIQPMSVAKWTTSPCVHVGLVGDLAGDRDEEAALHVDDALRLAGRAGGVGQEVRRLRVDLERRQLARAVGDELVHGASDDVLDRRRLAAAPPRGSRASAPSRPRREDSPCVITTFASLACSRCATAGAAKPEKIGTCTAPMCAHACDAIATSGDIGRKIATRSPGSHAELRRALREPRHLARELGEGQLAARAVLAEADRRERRPGSLAPSDARSCARSRRCPPTNQVVHSGPRESSSTCVHGASELEPEVLDDERPEPLGLVDRAPHQLGVARRPRPRSTRRVAFACSSVPRRGARRSRSRAEPYGLARPG